MTNEFRIRNTRAAKLTQTQVIWARERYAKGGCTQGQLARALGIGIAQMGKILRGEAWMQVAQAVREPTAGEIAESQRRLLEMLGPSFTEGLVLPPPVESDALQAMEDAIAKKKEPARQIDALITELANEQRAKQSTPDSAFPPRLLIDE